MSCFISGLYSNWDRSGIIFIEHLCESIFDWSKSDFQLNF